MWYRSLARALLRRKRIERDSLTTTRLDRCLSTVDLTALGIGSTLGLGIYVLAGEVASSSAGPSVVLSFFVAAVASVFAGLCYAEFGARVPKAGSAYVYSYVTVGEFMAFVIGWNLVLEYVIGTASVARGYSGYIDAIFNQTIQHHFREWMPMDIKGISEYPDFLAFGITLLLTIMLGIGVKESTRFNSVFTGLNLLVVIFVVIAGAFKASFHNWNLSQEEVGPGHGKGGFMPFGFSGMMAGAATCFYGFIGFDVIATTGEEVRNPQRAIPISIVISLLFIFLAYFGVSAIQTLMWPYWDQSNAAPLPYVFEQAGMPVAKWIITVGALAGLSTSLLGAMFPLPRVLYAMASDGLIFRNLANVHPRFKTPLLATFISGLLAGGMAMMFNVKELADMMSIGTLLAYTLVAVSVLILRYSHEADRIGLSDDDVVNANNVSSANSHEVEPLKATAGSEFQAEDSLKTMPPGTDGSVNPSYTVSSEPYVQHTARDVLRQIFNLDKVVTPTKFTSKLSVYMIVTTGVILIVLDSLLVTMEDKIGNGDVVSIVAVAVVTLILIVAIVALGRQPSATKKISFQVPWVPLVPILSCTVYFYLMLKLSQMTWIRFAVWMSIGLSIYCLYGIWQSNERKIKAKLSDVPPPPPSVTYEPGNNSAVTVVK